MRALLFCSYYTLGNKFSKALRRPIGQGLLRCRYSSKSCDKNNPKICIVGSGPAGFYAAQHIVKVLPEADVDIYERLPVPFGLVRFGVAPDHPEVKNVINTFTKTAERPSVHFIGNVNIGKDLSLSELLESYNAVLLTYGAEKDRELGIPGEDLENVLSARRMVGWYNGLPSDANLSINLDTDVAAILGQGNVALDVARILLTPVDQLRSTDITQHSLEALSKSQIKKVLLIGRRGPLQVAFTIKELREMVNLPQCVTQMNDEDFKGLPELIAGIWFCQNCSLDEKRFNIPMWFVLLIGRRGPLQVAFTIKELREMVHLPQCVTQMNNEDFKGLPELIAGLPRPRKRLIDLLCKTALEPPKNKNAEKIFQPIFLRSPTAILSEGGSSVSGLRLMVNKMEDNTAMPAGQEESIDCGLVLRSIGYKSVQADSDIPFDQRKGLVPNQDGLVLPGLYVAGWLGTGPVGVILSTMTNAFSVARTIVKDITDSCDKKPGFENIKKILDKNNVEIVDWTGWEKIDEEEKKRGEKNGKPREKIVDVAEMIRIANR